MKDIDFFELGLAIAMILAALLPIFAIMTDEKGQSDYIKQLEQNNAEQIEEKEYYITRTQELENILLDSGIVVDDCECE